MKTGAVLLILVAAGCGASSSTRDGGATDLASVAPDLAVDAAPPSGDLAGPAPGTSCAAGGDPHALVAAVEGSQPEVHVYVQRGGDLTDTKLSITGLGIPQRIAMRDDGQEVLVAWGGYGQPYGVATISITPDGTSAMLVKSVQLGPDLTPWALDYVSNDSALLAVSGPNNTHQLVTLDRSGGSFAETTRVAAPGPFTFKIRGHRAMGDAILARAELGTDTVTTVQHLQRGANGAYTADGTPGMVGPPSIDIVLNAAETRAYSPADDPNDPITPSHLTAGSLLHVLAIGAGGVSTLNKIKLPRIASNLAIDPAGRFLVLPGNQYVLDGNGNPCVRSYAFLTVPLAADGTPGTLLPETPPSTALLFNDMVVTPTGHLVVSRALRPGSVPDAQANPLELMAQTKPGHWEVCKTFYPSSAAHLAVAPTPAIQ